MKYLIIDKRQRVNVDTMKEIPTGSLRLVEELRKKNIAVDFVYNDEIEFLFNNSDIKILCKGNNIEDYTHIIFRGHALHNDKEYHFKRYIIDYIDIYNQQNKGKEILIQNSKAIKNFPYYNKIAMNVFFWRNNLPYFPTYYRTDGKYREGKRDFLNEYPLIIKEYSGVNRVEFIDGKEKIKKNVFKLNNDSEYEQEDLVGQDLTNYFVQEFSDTGEDYRTFVKKGKVIAGFKRISTKNFLTVSHGEYQMYNEPDKEVKEIAEKIATLLEADFIAVDFMHLNGKPHIQEIGFHPGYKAYETKITDGEPVNIAEAIITSF